MLKSFHSPGRRPSPWKAHQPLCEVEGKVLATHSSVRQSPLVLHAEFDLVGDVGAPPHGAQRRGTVRSAEATDRTEAFEVLFPPEVCGVVDPRSVGVCVCDTWSVVVVCVCACWALAGRVGIYMCCSVCLFCFFFGGRVQSCWGGGSATCETRVV